MISLPNYFKIRLGCLFIRSRTYSITVFEIIIFTVLFVLPGRFAFRLSLLVAAATHAAFDQGCNQDKNCESDRPRHSKNSIPSQGIALVDRHNGVQECLHGGGRIGNGFRLGFLRKIPQDKGFQVFEGRRTSELLVTRVPIQALLVQVHQHRYFGCGKAKANVRVFRTVYRSHDNPIFVQFIVVSELF